MRIPRSKTLVAAAIVAGLSVIVENMHILQPYFGTYGPLAGIITAAVFAGLRAVTDKPLSEK